VISVVVVNRDGRRWIGRCLESLAGLPSDRIQILVVDNFSSDGSVELVRQRFPQVMVLQMDRNVGFGVANNLAAERADGESLLLLNNDAWIEPGCLERLQERLESDDRIGLVAPRLVTPEGVPQFAWSPDRSLVGEAVQRLRNPFEGKRINHGLVERVLRNVFGDGWYTAACVLIRRAAFDEVGGFDTVFFLYFEDADLCLRLRTAGWRLVWEPNATAVHAGGRRQLDESTTAHYRRSQLYYYLKHRPRLEVAAVRFLLTRRYGAAKVDRWLADVASASRRTDATGREA
jgi:GT2 family glycosyltransferase